MRRGSENYDLSSYASKNDSLQASVSMATARERQGNMHNLRQDTSRQRLGAEQQTLMAVVTLSYAARHWRKHKNSVIQARDDGKLRAVLVCDLWYVSVDDLNALWGKFTPQPDELLYADVTVVTSRIPYGHHKLW